MNMSKDVKFHNLLVLHYLPGKKVVNLGARFSNSGPVIVKILEHLLATGVRLVSFEVSPNPSDADEAFLSAILELDGVEHEAVEKCVDELVSSGYVKSAQIFSSTVPGLIGDLYFDYKGFLGNRAIIIGAPALTGFLRGLFSTFGAAGTVFLYHTGKSIGINAAKTYRRLLGIDNVELLYRAAELFFRSLGYVRSINLNRLDRTVSATLTENLECILLKDVAPPPTCNWVRGMIEGVVEVLEDAEYESEEVECINKGARFCKIVFRPAARK